MDEIRRCFELYDQDEDGYISYREAHKVLQEELGFTETNTLKLIQVYDRNRDGRISYEEFIWLFWKIQEKKTLLQKAFEKFDADKNGTISQEEARLILKDLNFDDPEITRLLSVHDVNQDGNLQYKEFVHFWNDCGGKIPSEFTKKL